MKEKTFKFLSVMLAFIMVFSLGSQALAAPVNPGGAPQAGDTEKVTVSNVEAGATVTAYQITKANYDTSGFIGYSAVDGLTIADPTKPTNAEVIAVANGDKTGLTSATLSQEGPTITDDLTTYSANLAPGYWVIIVSGTTEKMYNPMLAGIYYSGSDSTMKMDPTPLDATSRWDLNGETLYAKSTDEPTDIEKEMTNGNPSNKKGDDYAIGDTIDFQVTSTIPSYSRDYVNVQYYFLDTLSNGLDFVVDNEGNPVVTVKVNGSPVDPTPENPTDEQKTYTVSLNGKMLRIDFDPEYIYDNPARDVVVTYSATLNENAQTNENPETNDVSINFSNDPNDPTSADKKEDKNYVYTFEIDGEIKKTGTDGALSEAKFTLTNDDTRKVYEQTSNADGRLKFKGLDAGTYTLKETAAPDGYSLNNKEYKVEIAATYNTDGTLASYTVTIDGNTTSTYNISYDPTDPTAPPTVSSDVKETEIKNTKISELPSTGGFGTNLFITIGVCAMVVGIFMVIKNRRKEKTN